MYNLNSISIKLPFFAGFGLIAVGLPAPVQAQVNDNDDIVVIAEFPRGSVITDIPPVEQLSAEDIASYGVSSIADLVEALSTSTSSSRGRGSGRPIVLINGQRTSGFREIRDLPPEAIKTVQVFPEEVALQYGYRPDQRVINFILKDGYFGISAEAEYGVPTQGGQGQTELESTVTQIGENSRLNLNVEYQNKTAITESERDIIQSDAGALVGLGNFRTLVAPSDNLELNSVYSRSFGSGTSLSLNAGYVYDKSRSLLGLPSGTLTLPATGDNLFRYFTQFGPLERTVESNTIQGGATLNGTITDWRWSLTADYSREKIDTMTERSSDITALQAAIDNGTANPLAGEFGPLLAQPFTDEARAVNQEVNSLATLSGALLQLPSGAVSTTVRAGYRRRDLDSRNITNGIVTNASLIRDQFETGINIEIPIADDNIDVVDAIGRLLINGNIGYSDLSDFGGLLEFGFGLNWEPFDGLVVTASAIGEEAAPSVQQLGNPLIITPNVNIFDFTRGESVLAAISIGGNPLLPAEKRRDIKLAINYRPDWLDGMRFLGEYFRNNSTNVASNFPTLTPEIEAAFPDRVTRDNDSQLIAIDRRPVNYSNVRSERIRYGFNFSKRFGQRRGVGGSRGAGNRGADNRGAGPPQAGPPGQDDRPEAKPASALGSEQQSETPDKGPPQAGERSGPPPGARGGGRTGGGPGGRPSGGRWFLSGYHTVRLDERILIRPGVQELDLLNGSSISSSGGQPRHEFELEGGWFNDGLGFRVSGKHQSATRVNGGLTGSDLRFSDLTTLNLRMFINLDDRGKLTENLTFLKGSRIAFRFDNIFNDIQDVRDAGGLVPLNYQRGFVDPVGRYVEVSFRKRF